MAWAGGSTLSVIHLLAGLDWKAQEGSTPMAVPQFLFVALSVGSFFIQKFGLSSFTWRLALKRAKVEVSRVLNS